MEMRTDGGALQEGADTFRTVSESLQQIIRNVDSTAGELAAQWRGQAGAAAQQALLRFQQAGQAQIKALTDISESIQKAGITYTSADEDQASSLSSQMNF